MTRYLEKRLPVAPPEPLEALEGNDSLMEDAPPSPAADDEPLPPGVERPIAPPRARPYTLNPTPWTLNPEP